MAIKRTRGVLACVVLGLLAIVGLVLARGQGGPARFIVVTGISSSGKSATVDALKKRLGRGCAIVRLDDYIQKIIEAQARRLGWNEHLSVGPMEFLRMGCSHDAGKVVFDYEVRANNLDYTLFYKAIAKAAKKNRYVLVDTIIESDRCCKELECVVGTQNAMWVLLYCPLGTIEARLQTRHDIASFAPQGLSLAVYESFIAMYTPTKGENQVQVDRLSVHATRTLLDGSIKDLLATIPHDKLAAYQEHTKSFKVRFEQSLGFNNPHAHHVRIYPVQKYDLILNSGKASCEDIARSILTTLRGW